MDPILLSSIALAVSVLALALSGGLWLRIRSVSAPPKATAPAKSEPPASPTSPDAARSASPYSTPTRRNAIPDELRRPSPTKPDAEPETLVSARVEPLATPTFEEITLPLTPSAPEQAAAPSAPEQAAAPSSAASATPSAKMAQALYAQWCQSGVRPQFPAGMEVSPLRFAETGANKTVLFEDARQTAQLVRFGQTGGAYALVWPDPEAPYNVRIAHAFPTLDQAAYSAGRASFATLTPVQATRQPDGRWAFPDQQ